MVRGAHDVKGVDGSWRSRKVECSSSNRAAFGIDPPFPNGRFAGGRPFMLELEPRRESLVYTLDRAETEFLRRS